MNAIVRALSKPVHRAAVAIAIPLLTAVTSAAPASATTIERVVSASGIEAWLVHEPAVPLIAIDFAFSGGAAQDPAGKAGTAYLAASTLNDGVGEFDSKTFHERLERKAIELNFSADRDALRGSLRTLSENRDEAFEDLRLSLTAARFDANDVELNRAQILSALRRATTSPSDIANQRWWEIAFAGHPYSRPANGTLESMPNITVADVKTYAHRVLARDNLKIAVVGDIDAATVKTMLDRVFGTLPAKADLTPVANAVPQGLDRRTVVNLDVPQAVIEFGGAGIGRKDPDFMAAYIVNHILGGGSFSSRLYQEVREKRGLAYGDFRQPVVVRPHRAVPRLDRDARGSHRRNPRPDPEGNPPPRPKTARPPTSSPRPRPISTLRSRSTSTRRARSLRSWCSCSATISASITSRGGRR